jgi:hypothetical protein
VLTPLLLPLLLLRKMLLTSMSSYMLAMSMPTWLQKSLSWA